MKIKLNKEQFLITPCANDKKSKKLHGYQYRHLISQACTWLHGGFGSNIKCFTVDGELSVQLARDY